MSLNLYLKNKIMVESANNSFIQKGNEFRI